MYYYIHLCWPVACYMQHLTAIVEIICVFQIPEFALWKYWKLWHPTYIWIDYTDENFVVLNLWLAVWFSSISHQSFSSLPFFSSPSFLCFASQCHVFVRREILMYSPGVSWWAENICSWVSSEITVYITWQTNSSKQFQTFSCNSNSLLMSYGGRCHILVIFIKLLWSVNVYHLSPWWIRWISEELEGFMFENCFGFVLFLYLFYIIYPFIFSIYSGRTKKHLNIPLHLKEKKHLAYLFGCFFIRWSTQLQGIMVMVLI